MEFRSLDLAASECDGPLALTRSHPVPACIDSCKPRHPLPGGKSKRLVPRPPCAWRDAFPFSLNTMATSEPYSACPIETDFAPSGPSRYTRPLRGVLALRRESYTFCAVLSRPQLPQMAR